MVCFVGNLLFFHMGNTRCFIPPGPHKPIQGAYNGRYDMHEVDSRCFKQKKQMCFLVDMRVQLEEARAACFRGIHFNLLQLENPEVCDLNRESPWTLEYARDH